MTVADVPTLMGAMLVVVGTILVVIQFIKAVQGNRFPSRSAHISPKTISLRTTYPGLVMIGFGTVLLLAGKIVN